MPEPVIYYWTGGPKGTESVAQRLDFPTAKIERGTQADQPYILMFPTYGAPRTGGYVPSPVERFLEDNSALMVGIVGTGNTNFGADYCKGAHMVSEAHGVPILWRIDLRGTQHDIDTVNSGIKQHWETLLRMRGLHEGGG